MPFPICQVKSFILFLEDIRKYFVLMYPHQGDRGMFSSSDIHTLMHNHINPHTQQIKRRQRMRWFNRLGYLGISELLIDIQLFGLV